MEAPHPAPEPPLAELDKLQQLATLLGDREVAGAIERSLTSLRDRQLQVAILGQFKRGKSTLMNALLHREVLPTGVLPVTSVATELQDGPGQVRAHFGNGSSITTSLASLPDLVTEARNPENAKGIVRVQVCVPLPEWARGLVFLDCPGVGSVHTGTTQAAQRLLSRVDAAIFVISPEPPISETEREFLRDASKFAAKFFFVMNKVDATDEKDLDEVLRYSRWVLRERCAFEDPRVFAVSAREALRAREGSTIDRPGVRGFQEFVRELGRFLGNGRDAALREVACHRVEQYSDHLRGVLKLTLQTSRLSELEFQRKYRELEEGLDDLQPELGSCGALLDDTVRAVRSHLESRSKEFCLAHQLPLIDHLQEAVRLSISSTFGSVVDDFDRQFRARLLPLVADWRRQVQDETSDLLQRGAHRYTERVGRITTKVQEIARRIYAVDVAPVPSEKPLSERSRYRERLDGFLDSSLSGQTLLFLPAGLLRERLRRRVPSLVSEELERQTCRVREDLLDRTEASIGDLRRAVSQQLEENLRSVEHALTVGRELARNEGSERDHRRRVLEQQLAQLEELRGRVPSLHPNADGRRRRSSASRPGGTGTRFSRAPVKGAAS